MHKFHLYLGPMYAGKTTELIRLHHIYGGTILDYMQDTTPCADGVIVTHDNINSPCTKVNKLMDCIPLTSKHVYINEAQFFPDLLDFLRAVEECTSPHVIYIFGLDGDFRREPFGQILQTLPLCDTVVKLQGVCAKCDERESCFSKRITTDTQQWLLDDKAYIPTCRACYLE